MATLRALASRLGLSITTVSRALDGYGDVAAATRERVRRAAQESGYRPNTAARRLRKGASETIALVMPSAPGRFFEPAFADLLALIGEGLAVRHYDLMLLAAQPGPDEITTYNRIVRDRRADACILIRTRRRDERVALLQGAGVPFICHGRTEVDVPYEYVDGDSEAGFFDLTTRLIGMGHRAIAHIGAPPQFTFSNLRQIGWRRAMQQADLASDLLLEGDATEEAGEAAVSRLLAGRTKPTAIVCATDRIAIGAMQAVRAAGLEPGRDIAITGHDNIHAARFTQPQLTTMEFDTRAVAGRMVERLFAMIDGDAPGDGQVFPLTHFRRASSGETETIKT